MTTRLQPGAEVAGHRIVDVLGAGAMGVVYEAVQRGLGRPIALKVLPARTLSPATRARFEREARLQAMLDHPHVVAGLSVRAGRTLSAIGRPRPRWTAS